MGGMGWLRFYECRWSLVVRIIRVRRKNNGVQASLSGVWTANCQPPGLKLLKKKFDMYLFET